MTFFSAIRGLWWVASEVVDAAKQLVAFTPGQDEESPKNERCAREAGSSFPVKYGPGSPHLRRESIAAGATLTPDEAAERLAEYEAGVECLEPQDDCGLGGPVTRVDRRCECGHMESAHNGPIGDCSQRCLCVLCPADTTNDCWCASFYPHSSAAPGVAPVEAADKDPGVSHSPTPGSQTSSEPSEERPAPAVEEGTASSSSPSLDGPLGGASDSRSLNISGAGHLTSLTADEVYMAAVGAHWYAESALDVRWSAYRDLGYKLHDIASQMPSLTLGSDPAAVHDRAMRQRHNENREQ